LVKFPLIRFHTVALACLLFQVSALAQEWDFIKEKDEIRIYTREEPDSRLKSFKVDTYVHSTVDTVIRLLGNADDFDWWDDKIKEMEILEYEKHKSIKYYMIYDIPWPFNDRDVCLYALITEDTITGSAQIYTVPLNDLIPERKGIIRMTNYWQLWTVKPYKDGMVQVTMEGFGDPAGKIPAWLYNMLLTDTPLNIMRKVRERLE